MGGWRQAILWGAGTAMIHRLLLTLWLALVWTVVGANLGGAPVDFHAAGADLPALGSPLEQAVFGVWRRWDAIHYLDLAYNGYRLDNPGATVFNLLTPLGIRAADLALPGSVDLAALVFETLAFGLALTLLYRVVEVYYRDHKLAPWAVAALALMPNAFFFAAPMSESIHLAGVLAFFYFTARDRWGAAALSGFLATLARTQGVLLVGVGALMLIEQCGLPPRRAVLSTYLRQVMRRGWWLALIPAGSLIFLAYRASLNLPSMDDIYARYSYAFFINPIESILINMRWMAANLGQALISIDSWAFVVIPLLMLCLLRSPRHRRLPLIGYTTAVYLFSLLKINYDWGTDEVMFSQSIARYGLVLFPLTVLIADGLRALPKWGRIGMFALMGFGVFGLSALYVLALTGP